MISPKKPEYQVKLDTTGRFGIGQVISRPEYNTVNEEYDIRMKEWDAGHEHTSEGTVHISGRKRDSIKGFLEERRYVLTSEYYHYRVRARGKSVDTAAISSKIQELGLRFLWVHVTSGTTPD